MPNPNTANTGRNATQQNIRIPNDVRERVKALAVAERRSFGAQVVVLLERALPAESRKAEAAATASAE